LIDWISAIDKYFDYECVADEKKVQFVATRVKGHIALWWDNVKAKRRNQNKGNITSWDQMVAKLKGKFLPRDYPLNIFLEMQNLKHKFMSIKEYTEELYKLNIRFGHLETDEEKLARKVNGLKFEIEDELNILSLKMVEEAYKIALKVEEKLARQQSQ